MDAFALWFAIHRELGIPFDIRIAQLDSPKAEPRRWSLPHEEFDGTRALAHVLRELRGVDLARPTGRESEPPSLARRARAVWREVTEAKRAPVPWLRCNASERGTDGVVAYALLDREETRIVQERAKERGVRSNAFLLWALDRAVYDALAAPSPRHRWGIPVNIHGALDSVGPLANAVSLVGVDVVEGASPSDVRDAIRSQLELDAHWGAFDALRWLARLGGPAGMRRYAVRYNARPAHSWVGTFTNVPAFDFDAGWISITTPVTRVRPVGASAVDIGGRLTLTLHVHPMLGPVDVDALVARWRGLVDGSKVE